MHTIELKDHPLAHLTEPITGNPTLYARGNTNLLDLDATRPIITITGARACSAYGTNVTAELTTEAIKHGAILMNGGAYGIDVTALRAALAAESAPIVWFASGLNNTYPAAHDQLITHILNKGGLTLSLSPDDTTPTHTRFKNRNTALALISHATIITEAGPRSGSLHIAHTALDHNKPVGTIPGSIHNPAAAGTNTLLKDPRTTPITTPTDIQQFIQQLHPTPPTEPHPNHPLHSPQYV